MIKDIIPNHKLAIGLLMLFSCNCEKGLATKNVANKPNILLAISDDQSWCHAGAYGDKVIKTPAFDEIASKGVLFNYAYCTAPSCTPSRAGLLTGQDSWRLEEGSQLFGTLPEKFETYTSILEKNGYFVGYMKKGWGPGNEKAGGRLCNPAGPKSYESFDEFISKVPSGVPWCFWYGSYDPHRPYEKGTGLKSGINLNNIKVPDFLPDVSEIRSDIADYYFEIQRCDQEISHILEVIKQNGDFENTLIVATSDNGMPFPRGKATLYDFGVRMPLAICWGNKIQGTRIVDDFVSQTDFAPTFLEAAGVEIPAEMTGKSLMDILKSNISGTVNIARDFIVTGRERHAWCRKGGLGYGARMIRTKQYLYIRNFNPEGWPAGESSIITNEGRYGDVDASPSKTFVLEHKDDCKLSYYFNISFEKKPSEELYNCVTDPYQLKNIADLAEYKMVKNELSKRLTDYLVKTSDPRETTHILDWKDFPYYGRHDWETNLEQ